MRLLRVLLLPCAFLPAPVFAEFSHSPQGFTVKHEIQASQGAEAVWHALIHDVGLWWEASHTYSGDATNLSINPEPLGCFCERWPGGGVVHMTVLQAQPAKLLRLGGGLGPLQDFAVSGSMTISLEENDAGTRVALVYHVAGIIDGEMSTWASAVDGVLKAQLTGLSSHLKGGKPDQANSP
ncbi:MAG: hypothetical protein AAGA23_19680 [Pseudomonadota bacterium]